MIYYHRVQAVFDYLIKTTLEKIEFTNYKFGINDGEFEIVKDEDVKMV